MGEVSRVQDDLWAPWGEELSHQSLERQMMSRGKMPVGEGEKGCLRGAYFSSGTGWSWGCCWSIFSSLHSAPPFSVKPSGLEEASQM